MRGRLVLTWALFLPVAAGVLGAVWLGQEAVAGTASEVLRAETAMAARLLREPEGEAAVRRLLGERWRVTAEIDPLLDEAEVSADGTEGRAAVYDAESWFTTGTLHVGPDPARRLPTPTAGWLCTALALLALAVMARWGVTRAWPARPLGVLALGLGLLPVVLAAGGARRDLARLGSERIESAQRSLSSAGVAARVLARPGGLRELTGLDFVAWDEQGRMAATSLPEDRAAALLAAPVAGLSKVEVGRVPCLVAAVGQARLVLVAYEHARDPTARMIAVLGVGVLVSGWLASFIPLLGQPRRLRQELRAWSFLAPALVHLAVFTMGPLLFAAWLSLHRYSLIDVGQPFVGLENYARLLRDGSFWKAVRNTAVFTLHVPFSMAAALLLALLVRTRVRGVGLARTCFFLPSITSLAAVAMVWQWMLHDEYGLVNWFLSLARLGPVHWLSSPSTALLSIMIVSTWISVGYQMVLFQAGLSAIPEELYEAARLDGAGALARFLHVTLPGLRHTLFFVLVTSVIGSFQVFATVYVITEGGPLHATDVAVYHIYEEAWEYFRFGSASAMSFVLFAIIFAVTWFHFRFLEQRVQEPA